MKKQSFLKLLALLLIALILGTMATEWLAPDAEARPGGGHSSGGSSGGGSSSSSHSGGGSSGGGGSGGDLVVVFDFFLAMLLFMCGKAAFTNKPAMPENVKQRLSRIIVGAWCFVMAFAVFPALFFGTTGGVIYLVAAIITCFLGGKAVEGPLDGSAVSAPTIPHLQAVAEQIDAALNALRQHDPHFSKIIFLDFAHSLYHKYHSFLGAPDFKNLSPFMSDDIKRLADTAHRHYQKLAISTTEIVIANLRITDVADTAGFTALTVEIEANYTHTFGKLSKELVGFISMISRDAGKNVERRRVTVTERWLFTRGGSVTSPPPDKMRHLSCPSCGAAANFTDAGACQYCHTLIKAGEMQWQIANIIEVGKEGFVLSAPAAYTAEQGTALPTLKQADLAGKIGLLLQQHGRQDSDAFQANFKQNIVSAYFMAIYDAWSRNEWPRARHLTSDRLFESNQFWIDNYKANGWFNKLERIQIDKIELARIDVDKYYEALTARIFAVCLDYTVDRENKVIGGSDKHLRHFTEYWTFIRRSGLDKPVDAAMDLTRCPNCGAATDKMGQAADCGYCGAKISAGDFSWVLTAIAQDEAYRG